MGVLAAFGLIVVGFLSVSLVIGGLLNLGGCGDRIGEKYRLSNWIQIVVGICVVVLLFILL